MNTDKLRVEAFLNASKLAGNPYPGRGIVIGTSEDGLFAVQIYWIMGRSENSRNRVFSVDGGLLFTEAADPAKVKDPSLIIYNAMAESLECFVVSNGDQTDTVVDRFNLRAGTLSDALTHRKYEPDAPNFTPRITGVCHLDRSGICFTELAILKRSALIDDEGNNCVRFYYEYNQIVPGFGVCLTTYMGDGDPLPAFTGEPYPLPIEGGIDQALRDFWALLNEENRVSLAVKFIELRNGKSEIKVINKYSKVSPTPAT